MYSHTCEWTYCTWDFWMTTFNKEKWSQYRLIAPPAAGERKKEQSRFLLQIFCKSLPQYCTRWSSWYDDSYCTWFGEKRGISFSFFAAVSFQMTKWPKSLWPKLKRRPLSGNPSRKGGPRSEATYAFTRSYMSSTRLRLLLDWLQMREMILRRPGNVFHHFWTMATWHSILAPFVSFLWPPLLLNTRNAVGRSVNTFSFKLLQVYKLCWASLWPQNMRTVAWKMTYGERPEKHLHISVHESWLLLSRAE